MPDELAPILPPRRPTPQRPLTGLTILLVEDSRYASEAMRLLSLRSGARVRRADSLAAARRHLSLYRPSAVIVDEGLPDGSGAELVAELHAAVPRVPVLLGTSGDPASAAAMIAAGAQGFLEKPLRHLSIFQEAILRELPAEDRPGSLWLVSDDAVLPDKLALKDDLALAAELLSDPGEERRAYAAQFLGSLACAAADAALADAARRLAVPGPEGASAQADVSALIARRLQHVPML